MLKPLALALALGFAASATSAAPAPAYTLDLSVFRAGKAVKVVRHELAENSAAHVVVGDGAERVSLDAQLRPYTDDQGRELMALSVTIAQGDQPPQKPSLVFESGGTARLALGEQDADGATINGVTLSVSRDPAS
ncbi:MAG TPA: hypothetical protein VEA15_01550 [Caulobacteraceae bacterium]|nr:hypothetical protein [Caulobacteraceae bacterium]